MSPQGILLRTTTVGDGALRAAMRRMLALGQSPRPIFEAIAQYGEASTRRRFARQVGPDGRKWRPSKRAQKTGGQTLVHTSRLLRSITSRATARGAEWGTNVVYAAIHQLGGDIDRLAFSSTLRLRTDSRGRLLRQANHQHLAVFAKATHQRAAERRYTVGAHKIKMPARPYLGVNDEDGREILALTVDVIDQAGGNR